MKQTTFLWIVVSFLTGMAVAYGLVHLDQQARVPRMGTTDIFEVVSPDGSVFRLSYAEIERERQELRDLRQRVAELERLALRRRGVGQQPGKATRAISPDEAPAKEAAEQIEPKPPKSQEQGLKNLFTRIFSQPIVQDLMQAQIARESGELAAVLDLTDEQRARLEEELKKEKEGFPPGLQVGSFGAGDEKEEESQGSFEEGLQSILTPEQYQRYQEYTDKKKALSGASSLDREFFQLSWRLKLTDEQEAPVQEVLKEQEEKMKQLWPTSDLEGDASPMERIEKRIERKAVLNKEIADRMKEVLDEDQHSAFIEYQEEKDTETRLLQRLIAEEQAGEVPSTP